MLRSWVSYCSSKKCTLCFSPCAGGGIGGGLGGGGGLFGTQTQTPQTVGGLGGGILGGGGLGGGGLGGGGLGGGGLGGGATGNTGGLFGAKPGG